MAGGKKKATGFTQAEQELLAVSEKKKHERFSPKSGELFKGHFFANFTEIGNFSDFFLVKIWENLMKILIKKF